MRVERTAWTNVLLDASRAATAFQRAAAEAAAMDFGCGGASGSGGDELFGGDSTSHSFFSLDGITGFQLRIIYSGQDGQYVIMTLGHLYLD